MHDPDEIGRGPQKPRPSSSGDRRKQPSYTVYGAKGGDSKRRKPQPPEGANPSNRRRTRAERESVAARYNVHTPSRRKAAQRTSETDAIAAPRTKKPRRPRSFKRVACFAFKAATVWVIFSAILFLISAQLGQKHGEVDSMLGGGSAPFGPTNVLVLGTDERPKNWKEPGAEGAGRGRTDTMMLLRTGGFSNAKLSIPRDTVVNLPNAGPQKINAAYALGGTAGSVQAVTNLTGIKPNHYATINFENFPGLVNAMGGINVKVGCVTADVTGGAAKPKSGVTIGRGKKAGGVSFRLKAGKSYHLSGDATLALARVRKNRCKAAQNDLDRARRQQKIMSSIKSRLLSPIGFIRLPLIAWQAPRAIDTDMAGPTLLGVALGQLLPGKSSSAILKPSGAQQLPDGGVGLTVSAEAIAQARAKFEK